MAEQLICNQQVDGSTPFTSSNMGDFPSGQRGQTVNLLSLTSVVRIHHPPPTRNHCNRSGFLFGARMMVRPPTQEPGYPSPLLSLRRFLHPRRAKRGSDVVTNPPSPTNKKRTFVYRQRCVFWMMFAFGKWCWASPNDVRYANDVCLTAHWANNASLRHEGAKLHICEANASYRRRRCIIENMYGCALIYFQWCGIMLVKGGAIWTSFWILSAIFFTSEW